jgi:membrane protein implicated in regulation of membrane protease activity
MMESDHIPPAQDAPLSDETLSPRAQITALFQDVRALAATEIDYAKARLSYSGGIIRMAGIWVLLAVLFLIGAAIALSVGLLLILNSIWGPWVATASVFMLFFVAAVFSALVARKTAQRLSLTRDDDQ